MPSYDAPSEKVELIELDANNITLKSKLAGGLVSTIAGVMFFLGDSQLSFHEVFALPALTLGSQFAAGTISKKILQAKFTANVARALGDKDRAPYYRKLVKELHNWSVSGSRFEIIDGKAHLMYESIPAKGGYPIYHLTADSFSLVAPSMSDHTTSWDRMLEEVKNLYDIPVEETTNRKSRSYSRYYDEDEMYCHKAMIDYSSY